MKSVVLILVAVLGIVLVVRVFVPPQPMFLPEDQELQSAIFETPEKSLHWVSNMPQYASSFAAPPVNIVIDVDNSLAPISSISIQKDGVEYGTESTSVDSNKLAMRRKMNADVQDGKYTVTYRACWTDGSCDSGSFQFAIDRRLADSFEDHLGRPDIPPDIGISIENGGFSPRKIRIRKNTRVVWTNNDTVDQTVTAGSYNPAQNSKTIQPKEAFEVVFSEIGEYPYWSSSDPETMTGSLLVEN